MDAGLFLLLAPQLGDSEYPTPVSACLERSELSEWAVAKLPPRWRQVPMVSYLVTHDALDRLTQQVNGREVDEDGSARLDQQLWEWLVASPCWVLAFLWQWDEAEVADQASPELAVAKLVGTLRDNAVREGFILWGGGGMIV